jgi:cyanate permease
VARPIRTVYLPFSVPSLATLVELSLGGLLGNPFLTLELVVTASVGAVAGAVLLPLSSWTFLRRIPLGRALYTLALGGAAGAAIGLAPTILTSNFTWAFAGALAGLGCAVAWLRGYLPRRR